MQKWEYKTVRRDRVWQETRSQNNKRAEWLVAAEWDVNIQTELTRLGEEGWELVAVAPRSSYLGSYHADGYSRDMAGFTDQETWVFKRPQQ